MRVRWRRGALAILLVVAIVLAIPALRTPLLRAAGWALVVDEPVEPVDVIVVPLWAGGAGAIDAADLIRQRIANRVAILLGPEKPVESELARRGIVYQSEKADLLELFRSLGVEHVEVIENSATGTESEGEVLPSWCDQRHFQSIIVVSAPDHSRRVRRVLHRSLRGHSTRAIVRSARFSAFDPDRWWETRDGVRTEIVELEKLLLNLLRHPIS